MTLLLRRALAVLGLAALAACSDGGGRGGHATAAAAAPGAAASAPSVVLVLGAGLNATNASRLEGLLRAVAGPSVSVVGTASAVGPLGSGSLVVAIGDSVTRRELIPAAEVAGLPPEGFILRSRDKDGVRTIATDGRPPSPDRLGVNRGLLYGSFALLEELGFAFLHPLRPTLPHVLARGPAVDRTESPRWPQRGVQLHTMHPLELTDLLNGWGEKGPQDAAGFQAMLPEWDRWCEWAIANRQNMVQWLPLAADSWRAFATSQERHDRFAELVRRAHEWGVEVGADVPTGLRQQHAWYMVEKKGPLASELAQIDSRVGWLSRAGFDFMATELGTSEFTHPEDHRMLAWLDGITASAANRRMATYAKIHVSQGQKAKNYLDPRTGQPINFNFLPHFADRRLGVMPHTVQYYGVDDPAPTYGNTNFLYMLDFLRMEAGTRDVLWHPETAYWVSFDVDVPLALPIYGERRLHDLRLIAREEDAGRVGLGPNAGSRIQGQMSFSSGWEWTYWLNDVLCARASWDPMPSAPSDEAAFREHLACVVRPFGAAADAVRDRIVAVVKDEQALLIEGRVNGVRPAKIHQRNGQGYLQGWDTWDDFGAMLRGLPLVGHMETQPDRLGLVKMRYPHIWGGPDYAREIEPLLAAIEKAFAHHADELDKLRPRIPAHGLELFDELSDALRVTALRARQVHGLYDYVAADVAGRPNAKARLQDARDALDAALLVVARREAAYRVPVARVASWRRGPTSYAYGYLWTVHTLHYWWRDEAKAVDKPNSPFFMNIIDPLDVAFGEGFWTPLAQYIRDHGALWGVSTWTDGVAEPSSEPTYPPNGLRQRP